MIKILILTIFILTYFNAKSIDSKQKIPFEGYKLIWSDEFNGKSLNMMKWNYRYLGKRKLGYTTKDSIKVSNGTLKIIIHKSKNRYCSGMISTQGKFETKYGYFEIRAKLPKIKGPQSAFWLQSPTYGSVIGNPEISGMEIDIMEYVKTKPNKIHFTTHWDGYKLLHKKNSMSIKYPTIKDGQWHTFGLLWKPNIYIFYIDGKLMHTKKFPISKAKEYIILSAEISLWGGGSNISKESLPDKFEIDYIRVYKLR